jgi:transcription elongation factor S-II
VPFTTVNYDKFYQYIFEGLDEEDEEEDAEIDEDEEGIEDDEGEDDKEDDILEVADDEDEDNIVVEEVRPVPTKKKAPSKSKQASIFLSPDFKELTEDNIDDTCGKRALMRILIAKTLQDIDNEKLEQSIYKASLKEAERKNIIAHWKNNLFETNYLIIARKIIGNLNGSSYIKNTRLIQRLKAGEFTYDELALKNYYELYPESWKELSDQLIMREQKLLEGNKGMATDQFKCHGCGKRECTYYEMQTRSADEPMTIFITCLNCGKRWRQ